jgi:HEAT repeat protein
MHYTRILSARTRRVYPYGLPLLSAIILMAVMASRAVPVHPLDVTALVDGADLIVVGEVTALREAEPASLSISGTNASATLFVGSITVARALKGAPGSSSVPFEFTLPRETVSLGIVRKGQYGIFFLKSGDHNWQFFDDNYPALPASSNSPVATGQPLQDVTNTLNLALTSSTISDSDRAKVLEALGGLNTDLAKAVLREALKKSSGEFRLEIGRVLVAHDDIAGLEVVKTALLNQSGLSQNTTMNLAGSLSGLRDARAVPVLAELIQTDNSFLRRSVATALRQTGSWQALRPLSKLLGDADAITQYNAVAGLGEITHQNDWTPTFEEFRQHQSQYLEYWRTWVQANLH